MPEKDDLIMIPYIVYDGEQARNERMIKRLIIALVLTIILLFISNVLWLRAWTSYDYMTEDSSETVTIDGGTRGIANYVGKDGNILNGADNSEADIKKDDSYAEIWE